MFTRNRFAVCLLILLLSASLQAQWTHLPLDHWAYDLLERLRTRGLIEDRWQTGPLSRSRIADMLTEADRHIAFHSYDLSRAELGLLEQLKGELNDVYQGPAKREFGERHFLTWSEGKNSMLS